MFFQSSVIGNNHTYVTEHTAVTQSEYPTKARISSTPYKNISYLMKHLHKLLMKD